MIYLADADSKIPNLALMRLATHYRSLGETVRLVRPRDPRDLFNNTVGDVIGSSLFTDSTEERAAIEQTWGYVRWGGTGVSIESNLSTIADINWDAIAPDYSLYDERCDPRLARERGFKVEDRFTASIGFLTRGCRLRCGFCVVPTKEGKPRRVSGLDAIWRGEGHPKHLHLLDNDAFAPVDRDKQDLRPFWHEVVAELNRGGFRVCFTQGINLRLVDDEGAALLARTPYYANDFDKRILYTAWDNLRDEQIFKDGVERLRKAGVPPSRLRVFMLVGYRPRETWEDLFYRFSEIVSLGAEPYVMVFNRKTASAALCALQRWCNWKATWRTVPWSEYPREGESDARISPEQRALSDAAWHRFAARIVRKAPAPTPD